MTDTTKTKSETQYMVLARGTSGVWSEVGKAEGVNDKAAIKAAPKDGLSPDVDTFVAVPVRSWRPRTRKVEQVTRESWS